MQRLPASEPPPPVRIRLLTLLGIWIMSGALLCASLAACGDEPGTGTAPACERFCVSVAPRHGDPQTIFRFTGRGWIPRREVTASYGVYCPPRRVCVLILKRTRFRTDGDGRFVFRFRNGSVPPSGVPRPSGAGGGPVTFRQRTGEPGSGRFVKRTPLYFVNERRFGGEHVPAKHDGARG